MSAMSTNRWSAAWLAVPATAVGLVILTAGSPGHINNPLLPEGCGSCHVGHGMSNEPMLNLSEERFCYQCHGSSDERDRMIQAGKLAAAAVLGDVETEFEKPYHHPVTEGVGHAPDEQLPLVGEGTVRHAECVDCHNPHARAHDGGTVKKVKSYSLAGRRMDAAAHEYEICLKCHSDRLKLGKSERTLTDDFALDARSQHPVTRPGATVSVPSLSAPLRGDRTMNCSDCHRSDDADAPAGPHGSRHRYLLSGNYDMALETQESAYAFEFCYSCHDRSSILGDESFPYHSLHLTGSPTSGYTGTSCYTCHVSHGSRTQPFLLEFNRRAVQPEDLTRQVRFQSTGTRSGECYLNCHGYNHGPGRY